MYFPVLTGGAYAPYAPYAPYATAPVSQQQIRNKSVTSWQQVGHFPSTGKLQETCLMDFEHNVVASTQLHTCGYYTSFNHHTCHEIEAMLAISDGQKLTKKLPTNSLTNFF